MNVSIENGHRAKPPQGREGGCGILGTPAPLWIDGPRRHGGKNHDRRAGAALPQVQVQPAQLLGAKRAKPALGQFQHVDQAHEVHAVRIEAVPATRAAATTEALEEELAVIADRVVLPGDVKNLPLYTLHDPCGGGELVRRGQMTHISGMDHEARLQCGHPVDRFVQRVLRGRMRAGLEADVRVADLAETEPADLPGLRLAAQAQGAGYSACECPQYACTAPEQVPQGLTTAQLV